MGKTTDTLDSILMNGANKAVRAWNWTTGKTKADLASSLSVAGNAITYIGFLDSTSSEPMYAITSTMLGIIFGLTAYSDVKVVHKVEKREIEAAESMRKDAYAEIMKDCMRKSGLVRLSLGSLFGAVSIPDIMFPHKGRYTDNRVTSDSEVVIGYLMTSAADYVGRAECLPPRKNCLSRGLDKLKEHAKSYAPQPVPIPIRDSFAKYACLKAH